MWVNFSTDACAVICEILYVSKLVCLYMSMQPYVSAYVYIIVSVRNKSKP